MTIFATPDPIDTDIGPYSSKHLFSIRHGLVPSKIYLFVLSPSPPPKKNTNKMCVTIAWKMK